MPNYQNGKIYTLRSYQTDDVYIGSTTQSLAVRKGGHRRDYTNYLKGENCFVTSFNIIKFDDCYIELIENYPCISRNELERREGQLIREMECVNKCIAGRTPKEYYERNKKAIAEQQKKWREANKEVMAEKSKEYREANKEKIAENKKKYYELNKEVISEKNKEKYNCECGSVLRKSDKSRHESTKKHKEYMNTIV